MTRFVLFLKYTEQGSRNVLGSPARADQFRELAATLGVTIETQLWTHGEYDGVVILSAATEDAIAALALRLAAGGFVRTTLARAYTEAEFQAVLDKVRG